MNLLIRPQLVGLSILIFLSLAEANAGGLPEVSLSIDDNSASEAGRDPATFTISRSNSGNLANPLTVNYQFGGTATENGDYSPDIFIFGGSATIPGNQLSLTVNLIPNLDNFIEGVETISLELLGGNNYTLATTVTGDMTIADDVAEVSLSIDDVSADEAGQDPATFTITRSNAGNVASALSVGYQFSGTATENVDYSPDVFIFGGFANIPANQLSLTVNLVPILDNFIEGEESISLELLAATSIPNGYTLGTSASGDMTLADDVAEVSLSIDDVSADEAGQDPATFTITRSNAGNVASALSVGYQFSGTATENVDYSPDVFIFGGFANIPANQLSLTVNLVPILDNFIEGEESISLELLAATSIPNGYTLGTSASGDMTLADDVAEVSLSIDDVSADEAGQDPATFTITRSSAGNVAAALSIGYQFSGTATENVDYSPDVFIFGGFATIPANQLSLTVNLVPSMDGPDNEGDESIELTLLDGPNYTLGMAITGSMQLLDALDFLFADSFETPAAEKSCSVIDLAKASPVRFFDQGAFVVDLDFGLVWSSCGPSQTFAAEWGGCHSDAVVSMMEEPELLEAFNAGRIGDAAGYADWRRPTPRDLATLPAGCKGNLVRDEW